MEMYTSNYLIEFFIIKPFWDLNSIYSKVGTLDELYIFTKDYF